MAGSATKLIQEMLVDSKDANTLQAAKDYTYSKADIDSKDASTLQSAKDYTYSRADVDSKDANTLQAAKDFTYSRAVIDGIPNKPILTDGTSVTGDGVTVPLQSPRQGLKAIGPYATVDDISQPYEGIYIYIVGAAPGPYDEYIATSETDLELIGTTSKAYIDASQGAQDTRISNGESAIFGISAELQKLDAKNTEQDTLIAKNVTDIGTLFSGDTYFYSEIQSLKVLPKGALVYKQIFTQPENSQVAVNNSDIVGATQFTANETVMVDRLGTVAYKFGTSDTITNSCISIIILLLLPI